MTSRTRITLDPETHRRAAQRAADLGLPLAEYFRRIVSRDLGEAPPDSVGSRIFDVGASGRSDVARSKDAMIAAAFLQSARKLRRRRAFTVLP